jgi:carboxylate-amine ligase
MSILDFKASVALSMGVELELQLVNTRDCDLTRAASDLLALMARTPHPGVVTPEMTESMIEMNTGIHSGHSTLLKELQGIRDALNDCAKRLNILVAGGGAHPFQHWSDRHIFDKPRFHHLSELYGYLAKQFTIFGQHVHIGCTDGDTALYLLHTLSRYIPQFIALSASSPYYQGVDTLFDSSRLNAISAFPLSGRAPFMLRWQEFEAYFERMRATGIVASMKDFYWDIRPKPEYGTIEVRVFDTPLGVDDAATMAAYVQMLCRYLLEERPHAPAEDCYLSYSFNRFQAARFGLQGEIVDPYHGGKCSIAEDVRATLAALRPHAQDLGADQALHAVAKRLDRGNDASWMRKTYARNGSLPELVWRQAERWRGLEEK